MTPWFPVNVKPIRIGAYHTKFLQTTGISHWDGKGWSHQWPTLQDAYSKTYHGLQEKEWRGLASDPNARNMEVDRHEDDTDGWW